MRWRTRASRPVKRSFRSFYSGYSIEFDLTIDSMLVSRFFAILQKNIWILVINEYFSGIKWIFLFYIFIMCVNVSEWVLVYVWYLEFIFGKKFQFNIFWKWERRGFKFWHFKKGYLSNDVRTCLRVFEELIDQMHPTILPRVSTYFINLILFLFFSF